eukprot:2856396-Rhodomonas_salina.1
MASSSKDMRCLARKEERKSGQDLALGHGGVSDERGHALLLVLLGVEVDLELLLRGQRHRDRAEEELRRERLQLLLRLVAR